MLAACAAVLAEGPAALPAPEVDATASAASAAPSFRRLSNRASRARRIASAFRFSSSPAADGCSAEAEGPVVAAAMEGPGWSPHKSASTRLRRSRSSADSLGAREPRAPAAVAASARARRRDEELALVASRSESDESELALESVPERTAPSPGPSGFARKNQLMRHLRQLR